VNAGLIVAVVALVVAVWSLYLTALRPADVVLDQVPAGGEFRPGGYSTAPLLQELHHDDVQLPAARFIRPCVFMSNGGAHTALLEYLKVTGFRSSGNPPLWVDATLAEVHTPEGNSTVPAGIPHVLEPADGITLFLICRLQQAPIDEVEEYARRLGAIGRFDIDVEWSFRRSPSAFWGVMPARFRPPRVSVIRRATLVIDGATFVSETIAFWRLEAGHHHVLIKQAEKAAET
jgi:hypothetical protein